MTQKCLYRIKEFDLPQFVMDLEAYDKSVDLDGRNQISYAYSEEWRMLKATVIVDFLQRGKSVLTMQICTYIELEEDTAKNLTSEKGVRVPKKLLCQAASFGYGALRGIMYLKTTNTPLDDLILPPFNVDEVIKDDLVFKLEKK